MSLRLFLTVALLLGPVAAFGQEKLGTAIVNGQRVDLFSDFKWRYQNEQSEKCQTIGVGVLFCPSLGTWQVMPNESAEITAHFKYDDRNYGMFLFEQLGADDSVTVEMMSTIVLQNMAESMGVKGSDIPVLETNVTTVHGSPAQTIVYSGNYEGLDVVYANTILISPKTTLQSVTYSIGQVYTPEHRNMHKQFLNSIKLE